MLMLKTARRVHDAAWPRPKGVYASYRQPGAGQEGSALSRSTRRSLTQHMSRVRSKLWPFGLDICCITGYALLSRAEGGAQARDVHVSDPFDRSEPPRRLKLVELADWLEALARRAVAEQRAAGRFVPGLGHPVHKIADPRTAVIIAIAEQGGLRGPHLRLFEAIGRVHAEVLGRRLPLNGAGVAGAALADLGLPPEVLRGVSLLARAAGLLGHIAEELRHPIAPTIYTEIDRNAVYRPAASNDIPEQR